MPLDEYGPSTYGVEFHSHSVILGNLKITRTTNFWGDSSPAGEFKLGEET